MEKQQINIDLSEMETIACQPCGCITFSQFVVIKKIPKFLTGGVEDTFQLVPIFKCSECEVIFNDLIPPMLGNLEKIESKIKNRVTYE